jgi:hypothetical protein
MAMLATEKLRRIAAFDGHELDADTVHRSEPPNRILSIGPAFAAGTLVRTTSGDIAVEELSTDDRVLTPMRGARPLRWIAERVSAADQAIKPVVISKGALGNFKTLTVAATQTIYVPTGFGDAKAVCAFSLVDGIGIRFGVPRRASYFHLAFDTSEMIYANGTLANSFVPTASTVRGLMSAQREKLRHYYPDALCLIPKHFREFLAVFQDPPSMALN